MHALQGLFACWSFQRSHVKPFYLRYPVESWLVRWGMWAERWGGSWIPHCLRSISAEWEAWAWPGVGGDSCRGAGGLGHGQVGQWWPWGTSCLCPGWCGIGWPCSPEGPLGWKKDHPQSQRLKEMKENIRCGWMEHWFIPEAQSSLGCVGVEVSGFTSLLWLHHSHLTHCQSHFQLVHDGARCYSKQPAGDITHPANTAQDAFKPENIKSASNLFLPVTHRFITPLFYSKSKQKWFSFIFCLY